MKILHLLGKKDCGRGILKRPCGSLLCFYTFAELPMRSVCSCVRTCISVRIKWHCKAPPCILYVDNRPTSLTLSLSLSVSLDRERERNNKHSYDIRLSIYMYSDRMGAVEVERRIDSSSRRQEFRRRLCCAWEGTCVSDI